MMIALDQIDFIPTSLRRDNTPDAGFIDSIRTLGVLQPVLLRPNGNRYEVVKGERRVLAARAADLTEIPAHIDAAMQGPHAIVARLAATVARRRLTTTEQWRALCTLTDMGYGLDAAAVNIGIDPRTARQMERLGRLHPDLLAQYEEGEEHPGDHYLPDWSELGVIAAVPPDEQIAAARANGFPDALDWEELAAYLRYKCKRIPRDWALFHHDMLPWTEDLFAEPGTPMQFTTADTEAFLAAQRLALADLVNASKGRIHPGDGWAYFREPRGWRAEAWGRDKPTAPSKTDKRTLFAWIAETGPLAGRVEWAIAAPIGAASNATPPPAASAGSDDDDDAAPHDHNPTDDSLPNDDAPELANPSPDLPDPAPEPEAKLPLTKQGQALLAKARTEALRTTLRSGETRYSYDDLLAMLVIALAAGTVKVKASHHTYAHSVDMRDLAGRLLSPDGALRQDADPGRVAQEALARMLCLPEPDQVGGYNQASADSPRIPLAIGAIVGADQHLPRLDTEDFLAQVTGPELKAWAKAEGVKLTKVTEIRARMAGHAESWRPAWALFDPASTEGQGA